MCKYCQSSYIDFSHRVVIFIITIVLGACTSKPSTRQLLIKNWINQDSTSYGELSFKRFHKWQFSGDNTFTLEGKKESLKGTWQLISDTVILLNFQPGDISYSIDSSSLVIEQGKAQTFLFSEGKKIGKISNNQAEVISEPSTWHILQLEKGMLQIENGASKLTLHAKKHLCWPVELLIKAMREIYRLCHKQQLTPEV